MPNKYWRNDIGRVLCIFTCLIGFVSFSYASDKEYQIRAGLLYKFLMFIDWPESSSSLRIGILGENRFEDAFEPVEGKEVRGQVLEISYFPDSNWTMEEVQGCDMLYILDEHLAEDSDFLLRCKGSGILTVSEYEEFLEHGGMILMESSRNSRLVFDVHLPHVKESGVNIRSHMLRHARKVITEGRG